MTDLRRCSNCQAYTQTILCFDCNQKQGTIEKAPTFRPTKETDPFYKSLKWRTLSKGQKKRFPYCQATDPDGIQCLSTTELHADHIIPRKRGGADTYSNLQTLCAYHHTRKTLDEQTHYFGRPAIHLICGPPGSGKTTYVKHRRSVGDVVLDLDYIARSIMWDNKQELSRPALTMALTMRDSALSYLATCRGLKTAWVIDTAATLARRTSLREQLNADVILLLPTIETCISRIENDQDRDRSIDWRRLIKEWFSKYEPHHADIIIN